MASHLLDVNALIALIWEDHQFHETMAAWFARPNAWLGSERPADVLLSHGGEVVDAARAARFAALG